ncbi:MAG: hypothetical protein ABEJ83_04800 [Candidatus Nanohaloarchaea archaeon]
MKEYIKAILALVFPLIISLPLSFLTSWNYISILSVMIGATSLTFGISSSRKLVSSAAGKSIFGGGGGAGGGIMSEEKDNTASGGAGGGGGGGILGSGGSGGDYIDTNIEIEDLHEYGEESDPSTLAQPSEIVEDNVQGSITQNQLSKIKKQLDQEEGTIDFRMSSGNLFSDQSFVRILNLHSRSGRAAFRLSRSEKGNLVFTNDDINRGTARAEVDLDGFEVYSTFRVFLVWDRSEIHLHVGPEDAESKEERELREDSCYRF